MKTLRLMVLSMAASAMIATTGAAYAQGAPPPETEPYVTPPEEEPTVTPSQERRGPRLISRYGMSINLGGGVRDFTDEDIRDSTGTGGSWGLRVVGGTRALFGFELAYNGSAQGIDRVGLDDDAALVSNGLEGAIRLNMLRGAVQPYLFGGVGWRRYDISSSDNTSDVDDADDVVEIPSGAGLSYRFENIVIDARFTWRTSFEEELLGDERLHNWNASAGVGWEF